MEKERKKRMERNTEELVNSGTAVEAEEVSRDKVIVMPGGLAGAEAAPETPGKARKKTRKTGGKSPVEESSEAPAGMPENSREENTEESPEAPAEVPGDSQEENTEEGLEPPAEVPEKPWKTSIEENSEIPSETLEKPQETAEEPSMEKNRKAVQKALEVPQNDSEGYAAEPVKELPAEPPVQEMRPVKAPAGSIMESPLAQMEREFRQRARVIREQMINIQNSFVTIGFQLHWIKEHNMYLILKYKNIYEYAEKECGIGKSSCGNLISIIENFAERDENGNVIESISECYRNYSSSQLVAMVGMPESMKQQVTPDMSVRAINRMRKGIPDKQVAAARAETKDKDTADKGTAAQETASVDTGVVRTGTEPVGAETASGIKGKDTAAETAAEPGMQAENAAAAKAGEPAGQKTAAEATAKRDGAVSGKDTLPEQNAVSDVGAAPGQAGKEPVEERDVEGAKEAAAIAELKESPITDVLPASGEKAKSHGSVEENSKALAREEQKKADTLFIFDDYGAYHKAQKKVDELVEAIFSKGGGAVTVKIVCVQG